MPITNRPAPSRGPDRRPSNALDVRLRLHGRAVLWALAGLGAALGARLVL